MKVLWINYGLKNVQNLSCSYKCTLQTFKFESIAFNASEKVFLCDQTDLSSYEYIGTRPSIANRHSILTLVFGVIIGYSLAFVFVLYPSQLTQHEVDLPLPETEALTSTNNTSLAEQLHGEVRVLCFVLTSPSNHRTKAVHVMNTWGTRCNKLLFMSTEEGLPGQSQTYKLNAYTHTMLSFILCLVDDVMPPG